MKRKAALIIGAALLAGCRAEEQPRDQAQPAVAAKASACEQRRFEGSLFTACRYQAGRDRLALFLDQGRAPLRSFEALETQLGAETPRLRFAMNAGMYDDAGRPIGLYVEKGVRRHRLNLRDGPGNFHLQPNGVFAVDDRGLVSVRASREFAKAGPRVRWATQSGPMLLIRGELHPRFDADGPSRLVRNGVGVAGTATAWFAISEEGVSFGRFARFFRDELGCSDALYLDGTVSSLWDPGAGRRDSYSSLGPMVAVFRP